MLRRIAILCLVLLVASDAAAQFQPFEPVSLDGLTERTDLAEAGSLDGAERILRFVQVSDAHILDDDAPAPMRVEVLDPFGSPFESAQRAQEEYTDEVLDSIIRHINAIDAEDGLDFVINTGDNIDNELENELMRFLDNWEGTHTTVGPISGRTCRPDGAYAPLDDNSNDVTDACTSLPEALAANNTALRDGLPWYSAFGNHDGLIQGNVPIEPSFQELADGFGRQFIEHGEYVAMHFLAGGQCAGGAPAGVPADDYGHGFGYAGDRLCDGTVDNDGYYAFSQNGVRFIVLDTLNDDFVGGNAFLQGLFEPQSTLGYDVIGGYAEGAVDPAQFEWLVSELDGHTDELVVVMSHHTINSMFVDNAATQCAPGVGCMDTLLREAGYKTGPELTETLTQYPNVVAWIGGHTHRHRIQAKTLEGADSPGFWNVESSSLIDYPQEARVIELWQTTDGKGFLKIQDFGHDFQTSTDLAAQDTQRSASAIGEAGDQDVALWFEVPATVQLMPQPRLPRDIVLSLQTPIVDGAHGEAGAPLTVTVAAVDGLSGDLLSGLGVEIEVGHPDQDGASAYVTVVETTAMQADGNGTYTLTFTPDTAVTHFATVTASDPTGRYDDTARVFSLAVEEGHEGDSEDTPALGVLPILLLAAILVVRRQNR